MRRILIIIASLVAFVPALATAGDARARSATTPITFTTIASSDSNGPVSSGWQILDNDTNYAMFFGMLMRDAPLSPSYDYRTELAVAVTLGAQPTKGATIAVTSVELAPPSTDKPRGYVLVSYAVRRARATTNAVSAPFVVVKFPRQSGLYYNDVKFQDVSPDAAGWTKAKLSGVVRARRSSITIADQKSGKTFTVQRGPLSSALAALDGKTVTALATAKDDCARVTSIGGTLGGSDNVDVVDATGASIGKLAGGTTVPVIGVTPDGKSLVVVGMTFAGYVPRAAVTIGQTPGISASIPR